MKKFKLLLIFGAISALALTGCGSKSSSGTTTTAPSATGSTSNGPNAVVAKDFEFSPSVVNVKAGVAFT